MSAPSNILAFDHGEKRIGVAVASVVARLPSPIGVVKQSVTVFDDIATLIQAHKAQALVVGLPRSLEGNETAQSADARHFSQELAARTNLPVYLQDESVTSKNAEAELGRRQALYNRDQVDSLAAVYILEDFLQAHPEVR